RPLGRSSVEPLGVAWAQGSSGFDRAFEAMPGSHIDSVVDTEDGEFAPNFRSAAIFEEGEAERGKGTDGAAPNNPAKLLGRSASPTTANGETTRPPMVKRQRVIHDASLPLGCCRHQHAGDHADDAKGRRSRGCPAKPVQPTFDHKLAHDVTAQPQGD
uniref:hypothetical protein n=1 Tax=Bradyrhizobium altum TaxID=1571202 RepID=UPI001E42A52E